jgi:hypothetical protein
LALFADQQLNEADPDPLVRGTDPRIRISTKMSRIPHTADWPCIADQQLNEAVTDPEVLAEVVQQLKSYGVKNGLKPFELPARSVLPHSTFHLHSS